MRDNQQHLNAILILYLVEALQVWVEDQEHQPAGQHLRYQRQDQV